MGTAGAIFNIPQTYGNGTVLIKGAFQDNGTQATITHGVGWQVRRANTTGVYKVTLAPPANQVLSWRSIISCMSKVRDPASAGDSSYAYSGSVSTGDLQADGRTFYFYVYESDVLVWIPSLPSGVMIDFMVVMSTSILND